MNSRLWLALLGGLLVITGAVWVLQGIGVLPGSFMTGQVFWAFLGAVVFVVGLVILSTAARRPNRR